MFRYWKRSIKIVKNHDKLVFGIKWYLETYALIDRVFEIWLLLSTVTLKAWDKEECHVSAWYAWQVLHTFWTRCVD